jgi:hypothetical protein
MDGWLDEWMDGSMDFHRVKILLVILSKPIFISKSVSE